jgi:HK97 gp10 family phage protein
MPNTVEFKITGLKELETKLEKLPKKVADKVLRKSLREAGKSVAVAMAENAPIETGFLEQHFGVRVSIKKADIAGIAYVGPDGKIDYPDKLGGYKEKRSKAGKLIKHVGRIAVASVARFLEFGTSKMAARPFMTQAWESSKQGALNILIDDIKEELQEAGK